MVYLATGLARRDWLVHVLVFEGGPNASELAESEVEVILLRASSHFDPRMVSGMRRVLRRIQPAILHTRILLMDIVGGLASLGSGTTWVASERSSGDAYNTSWRWRLRNRIVRHRADLVIANSLGGVAYSELAVSHNVPISYIPNGIPLNRFTALRTTKVDANLPQGVDIVLFAGRLTQAKDPKTLINAVPRVVAQRPNTTFLICGDGPDRELLFSLVQQRSLGGHIKFAGHVRQLPEWIARSTLVVSTSLWEGQPNVVLEAMACGTPLVVSDIPAHREILDRSSAILVPKGSPLDLASAITNVLDNREAAQARAQKAMKRASLFSVEAMIEAHEIAYLAAARRRWEIESRVQPSDLH